MADAKSPNLPSTVDDTLALLGSADYVADRSLATAVYLALQLRAAAVSRRRGRGRQDRDRQGAGDRARRRLIRLQCYEGLDVASAVYEWNYARQMIEIRLAEAAEERPRRDREHDIFSDRFLIKRPLLQALEPEIAGAPVLLIDELDRTDEPFEAYPAGNSVRFPGHDPRDRHDQRAQHPPIVIITSNRTREIHDALKRRCFYYWVDYPTPSASWKSCSARRRAPSASAVARRSSALCRSCGTMDLFKLPGIAETIDWTEALMQLDALELDAGGDQRHAGRAAQISGRHRPDPRQRGGPAARPGQGRAAAAAARLNSCDAGTELLRFARNDRRCLLRRRSPSEAVCGDD